MVVVVVIEVEVIPVTYVGTLVLIIEVVMEVFVKKLVVVKILSVILSGAKIDGSSIFSMIVLMLFLISASMSSNVLSSTVVSSSTYAFALTMISVLARASPTFLRRDDWLEKLRTSTRTNSELFGRYSFDMATVNTFSNSFFFRVNNVLYLSFKSGENSYIIFRLSTNDNSDSTIANDEVVMIDAVVLVVVIGRIVVVVVIESVVVNLIGAKLVVVIGIVVLTGVVEVFRVVRVEI